MIFFFKYTVLNLILFLKSLLFSPFSRLERHRLSNAFFCLQYPFFGKRYVHISELLNDDELEVTISPVKARMHNTTSFELMAICSLLKDNKSNVVFEIGTFDGRTTRAMALNLNNEQGKILTLNLPPASNNVSLSTSAVDVQLASKVISGERFINSPQKKYIHQLWGDSASFDFSPYLNSIDFVFIDGAHSEHYVKNDTEKALQLIRQSGGIIVWHDAHLFGVVKYLRPWIIENKLPVYFIKDTSLAVARVVNGEIVDFVKN